MFQGDFENNKITGFLEHLSNNESKQGIAKDSNFENGIILYARTGEDCLFIEGEFNIDTVCSGSGRLDCPENGLIFEGEFSDFCSNGWGLASIKDKFIYKGQYSKGKFDGYGEIYYPDGAMFFGFFKDSLKNGLSISFTSDGKVSFGTYQNNNKNGPFVIFFKNYLAIELFNHGFRSRLFEKFESGKTYFRSFYPEYEWICRINMKKIVEYFNEIKAEEYLIEAVPEPLPGDKLQKRDYEQSKDKNKNCNNVKTIINNEKKEISLIQRIRESMKRDMDSA